MYRPLRDEERSDCRRLPGLCNVAMEADAVAPKCGPKDPVDPDANEDPVAAIRLLVRSSNGRELVAVWTTAGQLFRLPAGISYQSALLAPWERAGAVVSLSGDLHPGLPLLPESWVADWTGRLEKRAAAETTSEKVPRLMCDGEYVRWDAAQQRCVPTGREPAPFDIREYAPAAPAPPALPENDAAQTPCRPLIERRAADGSCAPVVDRILCRDVVRRVWQTDGQTCGPCRPPYVQSPDGVCLEDPSASTAGALPTTVMFLSGEAGTPWSAAALDQVLALEPIYPQCFYSGVARLKQPEGLVAPLLFALPTVVDKVRTRFIRDLTDADKSCPTLVGTLPDGDGPVWNDKLLEDRYQCLPKSRLKQIQPKQPNRAAPAPTVARLPPQIAALIPGLSAAFLSAFDSLAVLTDTADRLATAASFTPQEAAARLEAVRLAGYMGLLDARRRLQTDPVWQQGLALELKADNDPAAARRRIYQRVLLPALYLAARLQPLAAAAAGPTPAMTAAAPILAPAVVSGRGFSLPAASVVASRPSGRGFTLAAAPTASTRSLSRSSGAGTGMVNVGRPSMWARLGGAAVGQGVFGGTFGAPPPNYPHAPPSTAQSRGPHTDHGPPQKAPPSSAQSLGPRHSGPRRNDDPLQNAAGGLSGSVGGASMVECADDPALDECRSLGAAAGSDIRSCRPCALDGTADCEPAPLAQIVCDAPADVPFPYAVLDARRSYVVGAVARDGSLRRVEPPSPLPASGVPLNAIAAVLGAGAPPPNYRPAELLPNYLALDQVPAAAMFDGWHRTPNCLPPLCAHPFAYDPALRRCLSVKLSPKVSHPLAPQPLLAPDGAPGAPEAPGAPQAPMEGPGAPQAPIAPEAPGAPPAPMAPEAPGAPSAPIAPEAPGAPPAPMAPEAPGAPLAPTAPGAPPAPSAPGARGPEAGLGRAPKTPADKWRWLAIGGGSVGAGASEGLGGGRPRLGGITAKLGGGRPRSGGLTGEQIVRRARESLALPTVGLPPLAPRPRRRTATAWSGEPTTALPLRRFSPRIDIVLLNPVPDMLRDAQPPVSAGTNHSAARHWRPVVF